MSIYLYIKAINGVKESFNTNCFLRCGEGIASYHIDIQFPRQHEVMPKYALKLRHTYVQFLWISY